MSPKTIAIFLPVATGILYGLNYAMNGHVLRTVSAPTWMVFWCLTGLCTATALHFFSPMKIDFGPILATGTLKYAVISVAASMLGWIFYLFVTQNISATYAAIGEVSYPLFTALFAYLFFQSRQLDLSTALGGLLILAGSIIVITDKIKLQ